ncbi:hypothetical protein QR680_011618 [Steinernema hermaphroditum]|uniref:Uncharacterized protein n=1 Tax=Steinernema hermaphroditum TaxID=289476 RepID=A0AA39LZ08_9BILA|nr:hypothetical protein QR680_011618 [Steinernema hermaphroditum]
MTIRHVGNISNYPLCKPSTSYDISQSGHDFGTEFDPESRSESPSSVSSQDSGHRLGWEDVENTSEIPRTRDSERPQSPSSVLSQDSGHPSESEVEVGVAATCQRPESPSSVSSQDSQHGHEVTDAFEKGREALQEISDMPDCCDREEYRKCEAFFCTYMFKLAQLQRKKETAQRVKDNLEEKSELLCELFDECEETLTFYLECCFEDLKYPEEGSVDPMAKNLGQLHDGLLFFKDWIETASRVQIFKHTSYFTALRSWIQECKYDEFMKVLELSL